MRTKLAALALALAFPTTVLAQNQQPQPAQSPQPQQVQYPYSPPGQYPYPPPCQCPQYPYPPQGAYPYPPPQYGYNNMEQQAKIQSLIDRGVRRNKAEIQREATYLSPAEKRTLYDRNKKEGAAGWAALDFFVGFGLGSYMQGDLAFGIAQNVLDLAGHSVLWAGVGELDEDIMITGFIILGTSRIMSWIFPFVHQSGYNKTLDAALNGNSFSYSIDPLIVPRDGLPAVGLAFNLKL